MVLKQIFQSLIALHQEEFPYQLIDRDMFLPINSNNIITVTGIRRCGKSSQLKLVINKLIASGVSKERILYLGFDDERFALMNLNNFEDILQAYREMYPGQPLKDVYMFFDEIQLIKGWELFVLRVYKNYCKNIFITGSTAKMSSAVITTDQRGYTYEYKQQVLSFEEYMRFKNISANKFTEDGASILKHAFKQYCWEGGFPKVVLTEEKTEKTKLLQSYFNTILFRDLIEHYNIKASPSIVRYFLKRVMENLTKPTSINNIYNELKSMGMKVGKDCLYEWIEYACQIYLFAKIQKYTNSLVKESSALSKYYISDIGIRNAVLAPQSSDNGKALENIVFNNIYSTLNDNDKIMFYNESHECDFVVLRSGRVEQLIQICWELNNDNYKREFDGLLAASNATKCNNCKVITFDQNGSYNYQNINITVESIWNKSLL